MTFIPQNEAIDRICVSLGVPNSTERLALLAEVARSVLWTLTRGGAEPVYVTRLLNAIRYAAGPLIIYRPPAPAAPASEPDVARMIVDDLVAIGDIAELPRGYWLPSPMRIVTLEHTKRTLLLGGAPVLLLSKTISQQISLHGIVRVLANIPEDASLSKHQSAADWLRSPPARVDTWADTILKAHMPLEYVGPMTDIACYYPITPHPFQFSRWIRPDTVDQDGRYLLRHTPARAPVGYWIGEIRSARVVTATDLILHDGDPRRLMYGLDLLAGTPVSVHIERRANLWSFKLTNEIPAAEQRLFTALGRLRVPDNNRYYPRWWDVHGQPERDELVVALQRRLGIHIALQ